MEEGLFGKQIADALRFLGLKRTTPATPELKEKARQFVHLQRQIHHNQQVAEEYYRRISNFGGASFSLLEQVAPPPPPVRDLLEKALEDVHIPGRAVRGVLYTPWDILLDFAFPATRLCIRIGGKDDLDCQDTYSLIGDGWDVMGFSESEIRRDPTACALKVKREYFSWKRASRQRS